MTRPRLVGELARRLAQRLRALGGTVVAGPPIGGAILAYAVAAEAGIPVMFFDKTAEGKLSLRRGYTLGERDRVAIIDDICSTGHTIAAAEACLRELGATYAGTLIVVDRRGGSPPESLARLAGPFAALLTKDTPRSEEPERCALCAGGKPWVIHKHRSVKLGGLNY
jgi:orotate phosphoribosyltransferase